jgi:hypothetical protein
MKDIMKIFWSYIIGNGVEKATDELFEARMTICRSNTCKSYQKPFKIKALERCGSCGCFLNAKARIDESFIECPKKLW